MEERNQRTPNSELLGITPGARPIGAPSVGALPCRAGIGLKPQHFIEILETRPDIGFLEIHAENYLVAGGPLHHFLGRLREHYEISIHGVSLSIGGQAGLDDSHLHRLKYLLDRYEPAMFSEHLAWSTHEGTFLNDLLPLPYTTASLLRVCEHVERTQEVLRRQMLLENPATYLEFESSTMSEADFLTDVIKRTGCGLLLDVSNAYVSGSNHGRSAAAYIGQLPLSAVGELHIAGFSRQFDDSGDTVLIDTHGAAVADPVWALLRDVTRRCGPIPTLLERDNNVPELPVLLAEATQADRLLSNAAASGQPAAGSPMSAPQVSDAPRPPAARLPT